MRSFKRYSLSVAALLLLIVGTSDFAHADTVGSVDPQREVTFIAPSIDLREAMDKVNAKTDQCRAKIFRKFPNISRADGLYLGLLQDCLKAHLPKTIVATVHPPEKIIY